MRIILEPSKDQSNEVFPNHRVVIEHPSEDLVLHEVVELLKGALMAYGYLPANVDELIESK